jgi:hypothetical protein
MIVEKKSSEQRTGNREHGRPSASPAFSFSFSNSNVLGLGLGLGLGAQWYDTYGRIKSYAAFGIHWNRMGRLSQTLDDRHPGSIIGTNE